MVKAGDDYGWIFVGISVVIAIIILLFQSGVFNVDDIFSKEEKSCEFTFENCIAMESYFIMQGGFIDLGCIQKNESHKPLDKEGEGEKK